MWPFGKFAQLVLRRRLMTHYIWHTDADATLYCDGSVAVWTMHSSAASVRAEGAVCACRGVCLPGRCLLHAGSVCMVCSTPNAPVLTQQFVFVTHALFMMLWGVQVVVSTHADSVASQLDSRKVRIFASTSQAHL